MTKPLKLDDLARASYEAYPIAHPQDGEQWSWDWMIENKWVMPEAYRLMTSAILTTIKEAGWAIVPVEPTEGMLDEVDDNFVVGCCNLDRQEAKEIWQAMQSVAPTILKE